MKTQDEPLATILVVDDDESFRNVIKQTLETRRLKVLIAGNGKEALSVIGLKEIDLVLSDIKMPEMHGIELLHAIRSKYPSLSVILMTGFSDLIEIHEASELGAKGFLNKPFKAADLFDCLENVLKENNASISLEETPVKQKKTMHDPSEFCHILIDEFTFGSRIQFPIYLKLSSDKMIKLANHGEDLPTSSIGRLKTKGVKYLYLENEDFKKYLQFNTRILGAMAKSSKIDPKRKSAFINQTLKNMMKFGVEKDFNPDLAEIAKRNIEIVVNIYADQGKSLSFLEQFMNSGDLYDHSVHVSLVATMIARSLGWTSSQKLFLVTAAGLFHDVGKQELDPDLLKKPIADMDEEELKIFQSHAEIGADIMKKMGGLPEGLDQIILHHHERVDGSGFPNGYGRVKIHSVAKIISLADDFCHAWSDSIAANKKPNPRRILENIEDNRTFYEGDHIRALVQSINEELRPKKSDFVKSIA